MQILMKFCQWLAAERSRRAITSNTLAMITGIPRSTCSALEAGRIKPNMAHLLAFARWAGCTATDDAQRLAAAFLESGGTITVDPLPPKQGADIVASLAAALVVHSSC